jgi:hypothetical protein
MRVAQEQLGGASARPGGGGGGSQRSQINLQSRPEYRKRHKNGRFPALIDLKNAKNAVFYFKILNKIYSQDVF